MIFLEEKFEDRHLGVGAEQIKEMCQTIGVSSLEQLVDQTVPEAIRLRHKLNLPEALSEQDYLSYVKSLAVRNKVYKSYIGQGYYNTFVPNPILRNLFENPGWYTQYTPYQAEIAQGRLESLLNFQTMVSDLTGLPIANASLLDEGTAAAEAMSMFYGIKNKRGDDFKEFYVEKGVLPQTLDVVKTRCRVLNIDVVEFDRNTDTVGELAFGVLLQYPTRVGKVEDYSSFVQEMKAKNVYVAVAADLMSLALLVPPGEWGADVVLGNTQRFGVPMGFGGPHAAYFATADEFKRAIPGRIIGVSIDAYGKRALRMALQTREQHIKREKATSNICTAQAMLANMAAMYAVYHGPEGIKRIAGNIHTCAVTLSSILNSKGFQLNHTVMFDTIAINADTPQIDNIKSKSEAKGINFGYTDDKILIALDETTSWTDVSDILSIFNIEMSSQQLSEHAKSLKSPIESTLKRTTEFLTHPVFNSYHTETKLMRYMKTLENKDLSLMHSMISLGSCTMKLNAAAEMIPVSWPEFANIHPFAPRDQWTGYYTMIREFASYLCEITGFTACSFQPNSGAQGEYAGLLAIKRYHEANGHHDRNVALIPSSAHGTNPASAVMAGMKVIVVKTDDQGNIDMTDLKSLAEQYRDQLACLMLTYPSTFGVFETAVKEICQIIHENGGMVYMDGANMNAQVGLTNPGTIGADVCHLNLHKTFAIPHGGGGPGMGPICCNDLLKPFLPGHIAMGDDFAVSSAPYGSASILLISYGYVRMLGVEGVKHSTEIAILNANYIKARLEKRYEILYSGAQGRAAHEMIVDLRPYKHIVSAEDVAKRLIDYGFHAPTLSFPVAGTLMIEPTESESKDELDRFCDAMLSILDEIEEIASGKVAADNNLLSNAPHSLPLVTADEWSLPYSREKAAYPIEYLKSGYKFWVPVGRVNNAFGDRNLICTCPPIEDYMNE
ncbi:MAG: aminomethyl-transferring glycine dehydrogenase [Saprospiraceae bacterium]|nr:aminomethyl-transferring glycine dehydrogenase [Saprospiraceae bacterium]